MDASIIFVIALTLVSVGALVGVEMHSRRKKREGHPTPEKQEPAPEASTPEKQTPRSRRR